MDRYSRHRRSRLRLMCTEKIEITKFADQLFSMQSGSLQSCAPEGRERLMTNAPRPQGAEREPAAEAPIRRGTDQRET
jgi:hypothetical protein